MKQKDWQEIFVAERKLTHYLLSFLHPVGKTKASFFYSHGYTLLSVKFLKEQLLKIPKEGHIQKETKTPFGTKFVIDGILDTPSGRKVRIRTVWIMDTVRRTLCFVTAYPKH